jgi:hypothetical protein
LSHFVYKNDHFTKTGSGHTLGKHSKTDRYLAGVDVVTISNSGDDTSCWGSGVGTYDAQTDTIAHVICR